MALVKVVSISKDWEPNGDIQIIYYHLSNGRNVSVMITRQATINLGEKTLASVITGMVGVINKQLKVKVPVGDQWTMFGDYIRDEFVTAVGQMLDLVNGKYPPVYLAPHEERQPRVLRLIDLGDGMLVPKGFVEMVLNDVPTVWGFTPHDFKQIMKPMYDPKGLYQSQYQNQFLLDPPKTPAKFFEYPEIKGPQPGPDKKFIPENHKPKFNPFVIFKKDPTKTTKF